MSDVTRSLQTIATGYAVFEKDQVLTPRELNSIGAYFDDETRLTRTRLLGVGLVCGLRVSLRGSDVVLTPGTGVTTDGDLLQVGSEIVFDRFKPRGDTAPVYAPLVVDGRPLPAYELLAVGAEGTPDSVALADFAATAGEPLSAGVAVLLVESHIEDHDLCTGTDCDNRGQECVNPVKLLVLSRLAAAALVRTVATPRDAAAQLGEIAADRAITSAAINSANALRDTYLAACDRIIGKLTAAFERLAKVASPFLGDALSPNDPGTWVQRLGAHRARFAGGAAGTQYFYALLKDLVDTWNELVRELEKDTACCCPDIDAFPKHLVLGPLDGVADAALRTGLYPSPLTARSGDTLEHARFLARRIATMVLSFDTAAATSGVRITPSDHEDRPLEERAIPCYYRIRGEDSIHRAWNFRLHQRGQESANLGYRAPEFGGSSNPFATQIGRYPFFRIEGHLGLSVNSALEQVQAAIRTSHVPIAVETVLLASDRGRVVKKPGFRFTDLHRLHTLVRKDVSHQLENVTAFSGTFKTQVEQAVDANVIVESAASGSGLDLKRTATEKHAAISAAATQAKGKIDRPYSAYKADVSWKNDVATAMQSGGEFKRQLTGVTKNEFVTPVDTLIGTSNVLWLDWLDDLIKDKEDKQDERQLFSTFASRHPGLEHFGGAPRGGTFVLAYDSNGVVIADFALPYFCDDDVEEVEPQPPLRTPEVKNPWVIANGINLIRPLDSVISTRFTGFMKEIEPRINLQKDYFTVVKDSITLINDAYTRTSVPGVKGTTGLGITDSVLDAYVNETTAKQRSVEALREKVLDPAQPPEVREKYVEQQKVLERELADSIAKTVTYVADSNAEVAVGSDGYKAVQNLSKSITTISDTAALASVNTNLTAAAGRTANPNLKVTLGQMVRR